MKSNDDKCRLIVVNNDNPVLKLGNENLAACKSVELFAAVILSKNSVFMTSHA